MSELKKRLSETMKVALKSGDKSTLGYARNLHAAIRQIEIDERKDVDDAGVQKIAQTLSKQRRESIDMFKKGGRSDLVEQEEAELKFLQTFLPQQLDEKQVLNLIDQAIKETGATGAKDMGQVMKWLMPKIQGKADGKWVSNIVKEKLP